MTNQERLFPPSPSDWRRSLIEIQRSPLAFLTNIQRTYGNFAHYRHGPADCFLINEPDLIHFILVQHSDLVSRPPILNVGLGKFLGNGLLLSSGDYHHAQRKVIQPIFTPHWIESYAPVTRHCAKELTSAWKDGEARDLNAAMTDLTMTIIYRTVFGTRPEFLGNQVRSAITTLQSYSGELLKRTPRINENAIADAVHQLDHAVQALIEQHHHGGESSDLLSRLLHSPHANGSPMSAQQIRDEIVTIFVAGQETSAVALTWLFYLLALHPRVEDKLRSNLVISSPYLIQVIQETLRLYPPAWLIGRTPNDLLDIRGHPILPGDSLVISPYVLHRTPEYFPDPDHFVPERFEHDPEKYTYLPFGAGPHVCIGQAFALQEMAIAVTEILSGWHLELISPTPIEPEPLVTLQTKQPLQIRLHKTTSPRAKAGDE